MKAIIAAKKEPAIFEADDFAFGASVASSGGTVLVCSVAIWLKISGGTVLVVLTISVEVFSLLIVTILEYWVPKNSFGGILVLAPPTAFGTSSICWLTALVSTFGTVLGDWQYYFLKYIYI